MATMRNGSWGHPLGQEQHKGLNAKHCSFPQFLLGTPETLLEAIPRAMFLRSNVIFFSPLKLFWGHFHVGGDCCLPVREQPTSP